MVDAVVFQAFIVAATGLIVALTTYITNRNTRQSLNTKVEGVQATVNGQQDKLLDELRDLRIKYEEALRQLPPPEVK